MDSDEFYSVFYGDDLSYEEKEKYNKNWWEYSKANSDAHFLIKKVYKGPVSVDDILIVDGALAEFDFKPSVDYIVFLEPRAAKNPYHIDTCLVVEYSDSLLRWYGYSGSDIDFPWYDKKYFKLLVNGLDGAAIGDHRKAYLESTKVPKIVMEIKEITERKSTKSAQDIEVR